MSDAGGRSATAVASAATCGVGLTVCGEDGHDGLTERGRELGEALGPLSRWPKRWTGDLRG